MLGEINVNIQSQNYCIQKVADLMMEFGFVDLCHHLGSAGGLETYNMVSDAARGIVEKNMCIQLWEISTHIDMV